MDNEEKYIDIAEKLKKLDKVEASHNFTHNLQAKIIEFESEKRKEHSKRNEESKGGFLRDLFGNFQYPWIIPAAGFTILIFFVFYITYQNKNVLETNNDKQIIEKSQSEKKIEPTELKTPAEEQIQPSLTESEKSTSELSTQRKESNANEKEITGKSLPKKNSTEINSSDRISEMNTYNNRQDQSPGPDKSEELSVESEEKKVTAKTESQVTENNRSLSEEKSKTMATVSPEAKDTNSGKRNKNSEERILMMKINKIDKKALEKIHEEISR